MLVSAVVFGLAGAFLPVRAADAPVPAPPTTVSPPTFRTRHPDAMARFKSAAAATRGGSSGPLAATAGGSSGPSSLTATFPAMSLDLENALLGQAEEPPDTNVAAGPNAIVEVVNSSLSVWTKGGQLVGGSVRNLETLTTLPSGYHVTDPRVFYDPSVDRWLLSYLAFNASSDSTVLLAASNSADPTGGWSVVAVASGAKTLFDQPRLGVVDDKVLLSWDDYDQNGNFLAGEVAVVQKSEALAGSLVHAPVRLGADPNRFGAVPALAQSSTSTAYVLYNNADPQLSQTQSRPTIGVLVITGTPAAGNVTFSQSFAPVSAMSFPPDADQLGLPSSIATEDDRLLGAVYRNGLIWTSATVDCTPAGDVIDQACARLIELSTSGPPAVVQDFDVGLAGRQVFYPAVAFNGNGDMVVGFSASSISEYPGGYAAGQLATEPGRVSAPVTVHGGEAAYVDKACAFQNPEPASRWGDYSGASSPGPGTLDVWVGVEYAAATSNATNKACDWGTAAGQVTFPGPTVTGITPSSGLSTGGTVVTVNGTGFTANSAVHFGGRAGSVLEVKSSSQLTALAPPGQLGDFDITITTPYGTSATTSADIFTYVRGPSGYWFVASDGGIFSFGEAKFFGSTGNIRLNQPIVGMADRAGGAGYWLVARDGGIFSFGDATFFGSTGNIHLNQPIVGMAASPTGNGYWFVASDGGIFSFGDAKFFGSTGAIHLNQPIVGMAATPTGRGYWLVARDGGIFSFGDATFFGSTGNIHLNQPIVGMAASPTGNGYWFVASDGGIFSFGDAGFFGSTGAIHLNQPIVGMSSSPTGVGYWLVARDGGIFSFGDAGFMGSTGNIHLNQPIVGMTAL